MRTETPDGPEAAGVSLCFRRALAEIVAQMRAENGMCTGLREHRNGARNRLRPDPPTDGDERSCRFPGCAGCG